MIDLRFKNELKENQTCSLGKVKFDRWVFFEVKNKYNQKWGKYLDIQGIQNTFNYDSNSDE